MGVRGSLTLTPVSWTLPSYQVASPSLDVRVRACSYCILLSLWLMSLGGPLFSGRGQRREEWIWEERRCVLGVGGWAGVEEDKLRSGCSV